MGEFRGFERACGLLAGVWMHGCDFGFDKSRLLSDESDAMVAVISFFVAVWIGCLDGIPFSRSDSVLSESEIMPLIFEYESWLSIVLFFRFKRGFLAFGLCPLVLPNFCFLFLFKAVVFAVRGEHCLPSMELIASMLQVGWLELLLLASCVDVGVISSSWLACSGVDDFLGMLFLS
jgi:hypothetical protein